MKYTHIVSAKHKDKIELFNMSTSERTFVKKPQVRVETELAVGDRVHLQDGEVTDMKERASTLSRRRVDLSRRKAKGEQQVLATNIDYLVIVAPLVEPDLHPRLVDRFLCIAEHAQITPLLCLNKVDIFDGESELVYVYEELGYEMLLTSAKTKEGIDTLKKKIHGKTIILVGQSGAGKSSLFNIICQTDQKTQTVDKRTGEGRHTTSSSLLYQWDNDSYIIDTPGVRNLHLWNISKQELQLCFKEFLQFKDHCEYRGCEHDTEDQCGVRDAVESGKIHYQRYISYLKLLEELKKFDSVH